MRLVHFYRAIHANVAPTVAAPTLSVSTVQSGNSLTATTTATDSDGTVASVEYFLDGVSRATSTTGPSFSVTFTATVVGSRTVTCQATDNQGLKSAISGSTPLTVTGANTAPARVTGLSATGITQTTIPLSWAAPANGGSAITDYLVEYTVSGGTTWTTATHAASTATSLTITGLAYSTSYDLRVSAINAVGTGAASATYTAATLAPTLTAGSATPS